MWFVKRLNCRYCVVLVVMLLAQLNCLAQFNRYYPHDRDSINTSAFKTAIFHQNNEILAIKAGYEYHSSITDQAWQYYLERFDLNGSRLEQISLNPILGLDSSHQFFIPYSPLVQAENGYCFLGQELVDSTDNRIVFTWISTDLDSFRVNRVANLPLNTIGCPMIFGTLKKDAWGGFFFTLDFPDICQNNYPGTNMIVHLDEQGELDWYRMFDDNFPISETIMDITRHPTTGKIYFFGNEAYTGYDCPNNRPYYCEQYGFLYECDSLGYNCQRIYHEQDTVDTHQECNFISVLPSGKIALSHPINYGRGTFATLSGGTPRMILFDENANLLEELIVQDDSAVKAKFTALYETENDQYYFIRHGNAVLDGNLNQLGGQIYMPTQEVSVFTGEQVIQTQSVYLPNEISINSEYWINSAAMDSSGRILLSGKMYSDSLNTVLPYMVLSDEQGCFPKLPCTPLGVEEMEAKERLKVYPNPATEQFTVKLEEAEKVFLHNLDGRLVNQWQGQAGTNIFQLENLPSGIYFLSTQDGFSKLVVQ